MITTKESREKPLLNRGVSFQTLQELLKQREVLDHQLLKLQKNLLKELEKQSILNFRKNKKKRNRVQTYVPRMRNVFILKDAIQRSMGSGHKMTMKDILKAIRKEHLYHTHSKLLYTMVNNKLHIMIEDKSQKHPRVIKISRGVFMLNKTG